MTIDHINALTERLRDGTLVCCGADFKIRCEAADEIDRLTAEVDIFKEALEDIATEMEKDGRFPNSVPEIRSVLAGKGVSDRTAIKAKAEALADAVQNCIYELRHLLKANPEKDGGLYRQRLTEAEAALLAYRGER